MPTIIKKPSTIKSVGSKPRDVEEYVGRTNTNNDTLGLARIKSPVGWIGPTQSPEYDEYVLVLDGQLNVLSGEGEFDVSAGEVMIVRAGETVTFRTPDGCEYVAVSVPAFSVELANRES